MYKLLLKHEDGDVLLAKEVEACILSFVEAGVHVEARAFNDAEEAFFRPFMAGAIVAAEGVIQELFDTVSGLEDLVSDCHAFCDEGAYIKNPCSQGKGKEVEENV